MKLSTLLVGLGLAASAILATPTISQASSILIDKGSYTADPVAHLDWLDLTATVGFSYHQIMTNDGVSYLADGWRYATFAEVESLYEHAGIVFDQVQTTPVHGIGFDAYGYAADPKIFSLIKLLGSIGPGFHVGGAQASGFFQTAVPGTFGRAYAEFSGGGEVGPNGEPIGSEAVIAEYGTDGAIDGANFPSYLVRDDHVAVTPLPAALPLFAAATGLMGFVGWRRRASNRA